MKIAQSHKPNFQDDFVVQTSKQMPNHKPENKVRLYLQHLLLKVLRDCLSYEIPVVKSKKHQDDSLLCHRFFLSHSST